MLETHQDAGYNQTRAPKVEDLGIGCSHCICKCETQEWMASPAFAAAGAGVAVILARDEKLGTVATATAAAAGREHRELQPQGGNMRTIWSPSQGCRGFK